MDDPVHCFCGWPLPSYVHLMSAWCYSHGDEARLSLFFVSLPLPCTVLYVNQRAKTEGGLGMGLIPV